MMKYHCQFCGSTQHDEASWAEHSHTCFSRTTTCSLCGLTMPTMHKAEHLRVLHGIETTKHHAGGGVFVPAAASSQQRSGDDDNAQQQQQRLSFQTRSSVMTSALGIVPSGSPSMLRAAAKSPTLSRVAANSGLLFNTSSSSSSFESKGRDGGMLASVLQQQQQQQPNQQSSSRSASEGFSFRSDDQLLRRAGTPERVRQLKQQQLAEKVQKRTLSGSSSNNNNKYSVQEERAASVSRAADKGRLQLVEDVVHNILSHSPNRRVDGEYTPQRKPLHLLAPSLQRDIEQQQQQQARHSPPRHSRVMHDSQHQRTPSLSLLQMAAAASGVPRPTAAAVVNEGMSACPDCGKVIMSQSQHHCPAQNTECPRCGETVALLAFDRHFIECAVPSWQATRERLESERMVQRNAASFRASRSSANLARASSKSQAAFSSAGGGNMRNNFEQSFMLSEDVEKLLESEDNSKKNDDGDESDGGGGGGLLACERRERDENRKRDKLLQQQADQAAAVQCPPPGHRLCVLCSQPVPEQQMPAHLDTCNSNLLSCPLCLEGVPAHELEPHQLSCPANRRRCFSCGTSIQFSRLADHVATCCTTGLKMTMYHGTTEKAAREIIKNGFLPSASGLLGEGVYMSQNVAKAKSYGPVILEAVVTVPSGKVLTVPAIGHRLQKSWQRAGYDAAWMPPGVSKSGLEEHCIKNPKFIVVAKVVNN